MQTKSNFPNIMDTGTMNFVEAKCARAKEESIQKRARYINAALLETGGVLSLTFSILMKFSSSFAILVGLHLPPVALAVIAIAGLAMLATGAYYMPRYRSDKLFTPPNPTAVSSAQNTSCMQRLSQYACCFDIFKKPGHTAVNTERQPVQRLPDVGS